METMVYEQRIANALGIKGGKKLWVNVTRIPEDGWIVRLQIELDEKQIAKVKPIIREVT